MKKELEFGPLKRAGKDERRHQLQLERVFKIKNLPSSLPPEGLLLSGGKETKLSFFQTGALGASLPHIKKPRALIFTRTSLNNVSANPNVKPLSL